MNEISASHYKNFVVYIIVLIKGIKVNFSNPSNNVDCAVHLKLSLCKIMY